MLKRPSTREKNILFSSQLYQLDRYAFNDVPLIEAIGDLLPGVVLINDMVKMENTYINHAGSAFLDRSRQEINQMGAGYFSLDSFCTDEMALIASSFGAMAHRGDEAEVEGFYQKVRRNAKSDWKQYYLAGKLLNGRPGSFIYMGLEIDKRSDSVYYLNQQLDIPPIRPVTFQQFGQLSRREKEILKLIATGYTNRNISEHLCVSVFTVETHRKRINKKLGTKTLSDLIRISDLFNL